MTLTVKAEMASNSGIGISILVSVEETATLLRIGRTTAYELVMCGRIQSVKVGRRRLVLREGIERYVDELVRTQNELSSNAR